MSITQRQQKTFTSSRKSVVAICAAGGAVAILAEAIVVINSKSNLAPLIGVLAVVPVTLLSVAAFVIALAAREAEHRHLRMLEVLLGGIWCAALAYTLFALKLPRIFAAAALLLQILLIGATALFVSIAKRRSAAARLSLVAWTILVTLTTAFPPIVGVPWRERVFVLSSHFESSYHRGSSTVSHSQLLLEWIMIALVATTCSVIKRRRR